MGPHTDLEGNKSRPEGRNGHSATLVKGQIWILGGWDAKGALASKELWVFDTATHSWTLPETYGEKAFHCNMHTCDYLPNRNSLLVFRGGDGRSYLNDLHSFDLSTNEWKTVIPAGRLPVQRANHASCVVGDSLYIFGGWDGRRRLNDIHVLNTRKDPPEWSKASTGEPPSPRAGMRLANVKGRIFMFGGSGPQGVTYDDVQGKKLDLT